MLLETIVTNHILIVILVLDLSNDFVVQNIYLTINQSPIKEKKSSAIPFLALSMSCSSFFLKRRIAPGLYIKVMHAAILSNESRIQNMRSSIGSQK